jgi:hypothetical protein
MKLPHKLDMTFEDWLEVHSMQFIAILLIACVTLTVILQGLR